MLGSAWGLASRPGSLLGGRLTDKCSEQTIIASGFLLVTLGLVVMVLARSPLAFLSARVLNGLGVGVLIPSYDALISKVVPEDKRGLAFGFFGASLGILSLSMLWIGAQLWEHISLQTPFWITAAVCVITIPIAWFKLVLLKMEKIYEKGSA